MARKDTENYLDLGASPYGEDCVPLGAEDYERKSRIECNAYIEALQRKLGEPPVGVSFEVANNPHDFGSYKSVRVWFDEEDEEGVKYAYRCEGEGPETWEEVGMTAPKFDK